MTIQMFLFSSWFLFVKTKSFFLISILFSFGCFVFYQQQQFVKLDWKFGEIFSNKLLLNPYRFILLRNFLYIELWVVWCIFCICITSIVHFSRMEIHKESTSTTKPWIQYVTWKSNNCSRYTNPIQLNKIRQWFWMKITGLQIR